MCKLMMICGIPPEKSALAAKFIRKSVPFMSKDDQDGLGYVALGDKGIFGERWLDPENAFKSRARFTPSQKILNDFFGESLSRNYENYSRFGQGSLNKATSILFHTRYATCGKTMMNTHPFVVNDTALIHNGVILNDDDIMDVHEERSSTCDSESILREYLANEVAAEPNAIQEVADILDGWYACGVLTKNAEGKYVVDVFKCKQSNLCVGIVPELESFVFCTDIDILKQTAKESKMTVSAYDDILGGKLIRMDAVTGSRMELVEFKAEADPTVLKQIKRKFYTPIKNTTTKTPVADSWGKSDKYSGEYEWDYASDRYPAAS